MSPAELTWLMAQADQMESVAEVGCLHGRSAFALMTACDGPVWCVDPWPDEGDHCYPSFVAHCGHFPNLRVVRAYSPAAAKEVPDIDMVFLDGDHEYEAVMADIEAWLPKTGKLICGHDYQNEDGGYPGVAKAVNEVFGDQVENPADTAIWAVRV
jgi:precorrin-6B methylase 2